MCDAHNEIRFLHKCKEFENVAMILVASADFILHKLNIFENPLNDDHITMLQNANDVVASASGD